jgi:micrococcal nuclease
MIQSIPIPLILGSFLSFVTLLNMPDEGLATPSEDDHVIVGKVLECHDGDSLTIQYLGSKYEAENGTLKIRLHYVDTPEYDEHRPYFQQPFGLQAKRAMTSMVLNRDVRVIVHGISYKRVVGDVLANGMFVNEEMLKLGLAWVDVRYVGKKELPHLMALQTEAQKARRGIWSQDKAEAPWDFRERIKREQKQRKSQ